MNGTPPEEPRPVDLYSFQSNWEIWQPRVRVPRWLKENPGLVLSTLYLSLSAVGVLYQYLFFRRFQFNVLEYSDPGDFLMVVVREPLTIAMASLGLGFYWGYMWLSLHVIEKLYRRFPRWRKPDEELLRQREKAQKGAPYMQFSFIAVYAVLFTMIYSLWQAKQARAGEYPQVTVQAKSDVVAGAQPFQATFLGTTSRFVFLYRPETKRAEAWPLDSIASLSWDARRKREREAEAKAKAEAGEKASAADAVAAPEAAPPGR